MLFGKAKRVILIGLDALMPEMVEKFVAEGNMPAIKRLMAEGVFSPMYSSPPVDTPTNWTSLATGAWTGTHGNNTFGVHLPGEPFDQIHDFSENIFPKFPNRAKDNLNQLSRAEYIWQAAERAGKRCILVNYPGGWPPNIKKGIVVDGSGPYSSVLSRLSYPNRYVAGDDEVPDSPSPESILAGIRDNPRGPIPLNLAPAAGWHNLPSSSRPPLDGELMVPRSVGLWADKEGRWRVGDPASGEKLIYHLLLLLGAQGGGYDRVLISREKDAEKALGVLKVGEWSEWLRADFETPYAPVRGKFKIHLEELSSDGRRVSLQRTVVFNAQGWAYPEGVGEELIEEMLALESGEQVGEEEELTPKVPVICPVYEPTSIPHQAAGIAAMTRYLAQKHPWDLLFVQLHAPDGLYHEIQNEICPDWALYDLQRADEAWERFRQEYKVLDQMVGEILGSCADEETLKVVLSDHGAIPAVKMVWVGKPLVEAGLLVYKEEKGRLVLDWAKSKVVLGDHPLAQNIWVNLKGRGPQGIVEPGEEYERVRTEAIKALYSMRDPETGECPVALALRTEEASFLGQWGDRVGDIVYYLAPKYSTNSTIHSVGPFDLALIPETGFEPIHQQVWGRHGGRVQRLACGMHHCYLPTARYSGCSVQAVLVMAGPGIRRGHRLPMPPWTVDVTPTITHLLGIPAPAQSEGKIVSDALVI